MAPSPSETREEASPWGSGEPSTPTTPAHAWAAVQLFPRPTSTLVSMVLPSSWPQPVFPLIRRTCHDPDPSPIPVTPVSPSACPGPYQIQKLLTFGTSVCALVEEGGHSGARVPCGCPCLRLRLCSILSFVGVLSPWTLFLQAITLRLWPGVPYSVEGAGFKGGRSRPYSSPTFLHGEV